MLEACIKANMAKMNRQLKFDSSVMHQQGEDQHLFLTPKYKQVILDPSKGGRICLKDMHFDHRDQRVIEFESSPEKKTPIGEKRRKQEDISTEKQQMFDSERIYCKSPCSRKQQISNLDEKIEIERSILPHSLPQQNLFNCEKKLGKNSVQQLNNLKDIVKQKQYDETFNQFQIPFKKIKRDLNDQQLDKENRYNNLIKGPQILNTEEKKIVYNEEYLQKLGLPLPESVLKQKMVEKQRIRQQNMQDQYQEQMYRKSNPFTELQVGSNRLNQSTLGIQGTVFRGMQADCTKQRYQENYNIFQNNQQQFQQPQYNYLQQNVREIFKQEKNRGSNVNVIKSQNIKDLNQNSFREDFIKKEDEDINCFSKAHKLKLLQKLKFKQFLQSQKLLGNLDDKFHESEQDCQQNQNNFHPRQEEVSHFSNVLTQKEGGTTQAYSQLPPKNCQQLQEHFIKASDDDRLPEKRGTRKLTLLEKKILLVAWVKKNLQDLNYWIQKSKSELLIEFIEEKGEYLCKSCIIVGFNDDQFIETEGKGIGKREAKKKALERAALEVIMSNDLLWEGVSGRSYVENMIKEYKYIGESSEGYQIISNIINDKKEPYQGSKSKKQQDQSDNSLDKEKYKIQKFMRQLISYTKDNKIICALEKLSSIAGMREQFGYFEIAHLWNYGAQVKNMALLKTILEVLHYRRFSTQMKESLQQKKNSYGLLDIQQLTDIKESPLPQIEAINKVLKIQLGISRSFNTQNPFEQTNLAILSFISSSPQQVDPQQESLFSYFQSNLNMISISESLTPVDFISFAPSSLSSSTPISSHQMSSSQLQKQNQNQNCQPVDLLTTFEWPALFFNQEKYNNFKSKTSAILEQVLMHKDPELHYMNQQDLNSILTSLLYTGDPLFSLNVCELIYSYAKMDPISFQGHSFSFFFKSKITIFEEFFENLWNISKNQDALPLQQKEESYVLQGTLDPVISIQEYDIMIFKLHGEIEEIFSPQSNSIAEGDLCKIISLKDEDPKNGFFCIVKDVIADDYSKSFKVNMILSINQKRTKIRNSFNVEMYSLRKLASTKELFSQSQALDQMCSKITMLNSIFQKIISYDSANLLPQRVAQEVNLQTILMTHSLSKDQIQALHSASVNDLTMIQTSSLSIKKELYICIMKQWLMQSSLKIIVKCESDESASQFFQQLSASFVQDQNYNKSQSLSTNICFYLKDGSAETFSSHTNIRKSYSSVASRLKKLSEECQVIILGEVSSSLTHLRDCQFNRVILLNSEQIPEQLTWQLLVRNCNQLVLIGDLTRYQRKTTKSLFSKSRYGESSLFERLIRFGIKPIKLTNQQDFQLKSSFQVIQEFKYFQHQVLLNSLHHHLFFESESLPQHTQIAALDSVPTTNSEILVIALKGIEIASKEESDEYSNQIEAQCVIGIVNNLVIESKVDINSIRVITPTQSQKDAIDLLSSNSLEFSPSVQTIEQPLNQNFKYLIFSGTRSNSRGEVGIARNPAVLSTLLQQTLNQLIFIGDIDLYASDPTWRQFFLVAFSKKQIFFISPSENANQQILTPKEQI